MKKVRSIDAAVRRLPQPGQPGLTAGSNHLLAATAWPQLSGFVVLFLPTAALRQFAALFEDDSTLTQLVTVLAPWGDLHTSPSERMERHVEVLGLTMSEPSPPEQHGQAVEDSALPAIETLPMPSAHPNDGDVDPRQAASEQQNSGRVFGVGSASSTVYQDLTASDLPGVRFSNWLQFKNRDQSDDFSGIAVEALIGPPDLRSDMMVDDYMRTVSNVGGTASWVPNFSTQTASAPGTIVHRVRILSPPVKKLLSTWLSLATNSTMQPITFLRPFREFIHYHEKMTMELKNAEDGTSRIISGPEDFEQMSNYINFVEKVMLPLKNKWSLTQPELPQKIRCTDLWYIFQPGQLLYQQHKKGGTPQQPESPQIGMLVSFSGAAASRDLEDNVWEQGFSTWDRSQTVDVFHLDFDGRAYRPVVTSVNLPSYIGDRDVRSLPIYPLSFEPDSAEIQSEAQEYGRKFTTFCSNRLHWFHSGWTLDWSQSGLVPDTTTPPGQRYPAGIISEFIDSEVIVDFQEAVKSSRGWQARYLAPISGHNQASAEMATDMWSIRTWKREESSPVYSNMSEYVIFDPDLEDEDENAMALVMPMLTQGTAQHKDLDEIQLALLPRRVFAYSLRYRKWVLAHVDSLSEVKYVDGGFKNLRINDAHLRMIKSLVKNHFDTKRLEGVAGVELVGQDFIYGKGRGIVMLLHGVPGVGKTATAEAVAQEYAKPLFPMTCGDLGTTPEAVSGSLLNIFRLANLWECVLLLDEADVFLSRREQRSNDLQRNALVSVFLRVLEYYSGVLFLTTNRPGVLDEAVKSRVHASFFYPHLGWSQTRDIFELNIERLRRMERQREEHGGEPLVILENQIMKFAEEHYHSHNDYEGRWNGRQIRNSFQIAASLAHLDGEEATEAASKATTSLHRRDTEGSGSGGRGVQRQLGKQHFQEVAEAILRYDQFRAKVLGKFDDELAKDRMERPEEFPDEQSEVSSAYGNGGSRWHGQYGGGMSSHGRHGRYEGGSGSGSGSGRGGGGGRWS